MTQKFEYTVLEMIESASRTVKTTPLNLGGTGGLGGGAGAPPGGFIGQLPQYRVAYDTLELASSGTLPSGVTGISGWSLVDNLNHIRYRLAVLESGGMAGTIIVQDWDGTPTIDPTSRIIFSGATVTDLGGGTALVVVGSGGGGLSDAPIDGNTYGRKDGSWVAISGVVGSGGSSNYYYGVRSYTDQSAGTSDTYGVLGGLVNGSNTLFTVSQATYLTGTLKVYKNGQLQTQGTAEDWTETSPAAGTFTFITAPFSTDLITATYDVTEATAASPLVVEESDGSPSVSNVTKIKFSGAVVSNLGGGEVLVSVSGGSVSSYSLTVRESDNTPTVTNVNNIAFSGATVTDLGGGSSLVTITQSSPYSLIVEEADGSPSITNVDKIIFSGATLTDLGSGDVLVTISGGTSNPSLIVEEADGSPSIAGVDKIIFSGASVTSLGSGDVLVTISGGGGLSSVTRVFTFTMEGTLAVTTGKIRMYNNFGQTVTISKVHLSVDTAPTGSAIIVDINKGGTTIFTTQANRPQIAISANTGSSTTMDITSLANGEYLTMDIDQKGSGTAGADLAVQVVFA